MKVLTHKQQEPVNGSNQLVSKINGVKHATACFNLLKIFSRFMTIKYMMKNTYRKYFKYLLHKSLKYV